MRLRGKVAIITGASQGMGESHARRFVKEGAKVIMTDVNTNDGLRIAGELGENALFINHDVSKEEDWAKVLKEGEAKFGKVNVLINNAGILGPLSNLLDMSLSDFNKVCGINLDSTFLGMKYVIPSMVENGGGSIVNVSSIAGLVAIVGAPNVAYVASKFGVRGITKQVAAEYGIKGIRVNSVHPGYIKTPMMAAATDQDGGGAASLIPLGRMAEPEETSDLMVYLASDESTFISGTELVIDGGMTAV